VRYESTLELTAEANVGGVLIATTLPYHCLGSHLNGRTLRLDRIGLRRTRATALKVFGQKAYNGLLTITEKSDVRVIVHIGVSDSGREAKDLEITLSNCNGGGRSLVKSRCCRKRKIHFYLRSA
jgi:hypothetical protein